MNLSQREKGSDRFGREREADFMSLVGAWSFRDKGEQVSAVNVRCAQPGALGLYIGP